ncbi:uncharacterized protein LOC100904581 [Galendromus occidentalis]|uniref:Uncharacterized protein LOC100904581 n=1 Tax=Galendromus occidentalis TaxID=34638 RepID=A0AAJ7WIY9_9ACAR|nr:uncharacterized protein LOC100904581 [Galendromus occidentalis]
MLSSATVASVLLALLISHDYASCQEDKRQDLLPFPRIGKRQGLIPFPRIGRSVASFAPSGEDQLVNSPDDEENWEGAIDVGYMLVPDYLKRGGHSAFTPRIGRKKRSLDSNSMIGVHQMRRLFPEEFQALFQRTMRQLIPSPRIGRADAFVPRLGKKSMSQAGSAPSGYEDEDNDFMVKRAPAFTPRIGRAAFTPRIGRSDGNVGQMRTLRTFTPRIGK